MGVNIMKKIISSIVVVGVALILIIYSNVKEVQNYNTALVLDSALNEYGLFNYFIGEAGEDTDPTIWIEMDETRSERELRTYLGENLSKSDLNHYKIEITQLSSKEVQEEYIESLSL
jgi:hypothetical protein